VNQASGRLVIRGGTVVDGTGAPARRADVAIEGGRITEIGDGLSGEREIDAGGALVAPGFLDIHTHYDPQVLWDPELTPSSFQGVTSVVAGNCGYSVAPTRAPDRASLFRTLDKVEDMRIATLEAGVPWEFETYPEYLDAVARRGTAINFGGYVGHTAVRLYVLGDEAYEREATEEEIDRMRALVAGSIRGGALGFSSDRAGFHVGDGGRPVPSIVATQAETEALMRVTADIGRGIVHVAPGENFSWVYDFQPALGRTITWSALLTYPPDTASRAPYRSKLARHEEGRAAGADVWVQVTCRPILQQIMMIEPTSFYQLPSFAPFVATAREDRMQLVADSEWRSRVSDEFESGKWVNPRWDTFLVSESDAHPELVGRSVASLAAERGTTAFDVVADVALADDLKTRFSVTFANDEEDGVTLLMRSEGCIMGLSDAGAHVGQICDAVMPTDFLANWVRDRDLMPVEQGIRKLTGEISDVLGLDRGYLRPGAPADVVVLDWDTLSPGPIRRVHDMPAAGERLVADRPSGIEHVLVNGVPIRRDGEPVAAQLDTLPGVVLGRA
jgi:N-acyl-D-aspartate/D-glutamate deacylase